MAGKIRTAPAPGRRGSASQDTRTANLVDSPKVVSARVLLDATLRSCEGMLHFLADVQQAQSRLWHEIDDAVLHSMQAPAPEFPAAELRSLMALQAELSSANLAHALQASHRLFNRVLEIESERMRISVANSQHMAGAAPAPLAARNARHLMH